MVKVTCEVPTYNEPAKPSIRVHNHWNRQEFVELEISGERHVVTARDLKAAIDNCTNTNRF